jgi:phosphoglycerol transferase
LQPPKVVAASLLPVAAALALAEQRRRQPLPLPFELALEGRAPALVELHGFSGAEPWGRWTDGPEARVSLARRLPECVEVALLAKAFGPNVGQEVTLAAGASVGRVRLSGDLEERRLALCGAQGTSELRIGIPQPTSPRSLGQGDDPRRLGVGVRRIVLRALPGAGSEGAR